MYCAVRMYLTEIHIGFRTLFRKLWLSMTLAFLDSHKFITFSCCLRFSCKSSWHKLISVMECHILFNFLQTFHNIWKFKKLICINFLLRKYIRFFCQKRNDKSLNHFFSIEEICLLRLQAWGPPYLWKSPHRLAMKTKITEEIQLLLLRTTGGLQEDVHVAANVDHLLHRIWSILRIRLLILTIQ